MFTADSADDGERTITTNDDDNSGDDDNNEDKHRIERQPLTIKDVKKGYIK